MTVKELITNLLECNMDSDVKITLSFDDIDLNIEEDIFHTNGTTYTFENAELKIDMGCNLKDWIEIEDEEEA